MFRVAAFREVGGFSPRLWLGGEEELLSLDLAARQWWMCWSSDVVIEHAASTSRDPRRRRQLGIRNTLWTVWLRRPLPSALRRTATLLRSIPWDGASAAALAEALGGLGWVLRERRVVPPAVEQGLRLLDEPAATLQGPQVRRLTRSGLTRPARFRAEVSRRSRGVAQGTHLGKGCCGGETV
jgi:hypothetical protein